MFYCEPETSGQGEELQVITKAEKVLRQLRIEVMLISLSLSPFPPPPSLSLSLSLSVIHKEFVVGGKAVNSVFYVQVLRRLLTRISSEGQFVSYA
jgi:hypothetical protein